METYKLIKKLPFENSPEIGYISKPTNTKESLHYWMGMWFNPKNYPEHWEEVVEKDYEILSFKQNSEIDDLWEAVDTICDKFARKSGQMFCTTPYTLEEILNNPLYSIHSVKRLSDGEVFTVGDKVSHYAEGNYILENIYFIEKDRLALYVGNGLNLGLKNISKVKKPFFITEDKVEIEEGQEVFWVGVWKKPFHYLYSLEFIKVHLGFDFQNKYKVFSTEKAARDYVEANKPLFTTTDGVDIFKGDTVWGIYIDSLKTFSIKVLHGNFKWKYGIFSTKEAAENYSATKIPILNLEEIFSICNFTETTKKRLINLSKEKINKL